MTPVTSGVGHQEIVRWRAWDDEAFDAARREGKLILLDIGAAWCHWCHVMDRTTYGDRRTADFINEHFIPVRVDRDARPDIDGRYQSAPTLIQSRGGGWPLTVFLLADGTPLYRATYLPPTDQGGQTGFISLAEQLLRVVRERRDEVEEVAGQVRQLVMQHRPASLAGELSTGLLEGLFAQLDRAYDQTWGGFYGAPHSPKFPAPGAMEFLLAHAHRTGRPRPREIAVHTLRRMAAGGVCDQLAGGFHRYSIDPYWRVPHFEKLLYDNAELLAACVHAWQATGDVELRRTAEGILRFVDEVLSDRQRGGYYGSQDADVGLDDDGDYFTWSLDEVREVLSGKELEAFVAAYDVDGQGRMPHDPSRSVLYRAMSDQGVAERIGTSVEDAARILAAAQAKALDARRRRPTPGVDTALYANWNGMMIHAAVQAASALDRPDVLAQARRTADRLLAEGRAADGSFAHVVGRIEPSGLLVDQAWMALALEVLHEATGEARYLEAAEATVAWADKHLWDGEGGGYFDRPAGDGAEGLAAVRDKPIEDNPSSGANAVMAQVLDRLAAVTGRPEYHERAGQLLMALAGGLEHMSLYGGSLGYAAEVHLAGVTKVVVIGPATAGSALLRAAHATYVPGKVVTALDPADAEDRVRIEALGYPVDKMAAYVCRGTFCFAPATTAAELAATLAER